MTSMLAREKWQVRTLKVLERVFEERKRQMVLHGEAMEALPDGIGPETRWMPGLMAGAKDLQVALREAYERASEEGRLTRAHLVLEELAESLELDGDDPAFVDEILQVAALCVQWAEYKIEDPRRG